ncbi:MAG: carboxypeptidase-like regulatory domain-containing protein [Bacteroidota bacterium]
MRKAHAILLVVLVIFWTNAAIAAQDQRDRYTVKGKVSAENGEPIPFATVQIEGTSIGVIADSEGQFTLKKLAGGEYTLAVQCVGHLPTSYKLNITDQSAERITIILKSNARELQAVEVVAETENQQLELSAKAVNVIDTREIKLKTVDLGEVLAQTQGVSIQRSGGLGSDSRLSLNGLSGDKIRFFFDGVPLDFTGYSVGIGNIPVNLVDRVELYKGVVPIAFGADALGGAVNMVSPSIVMGFHGSASYQTGSFGTHRSTLDLKYLEPKSGLLIGLDGFYDFSRNNYEVDVEVPITEGPLRGRIQEITVPRFHDDYEAYGMNVTLGLIDKSWADEIKVNFFLNDTYDEVQHNAVMTGNPFGEVIFSSDLQGANLSFTKDFSRSLSIESVFGLNSTTRVFVDTTRNFYSWNGEIQGRRNRQGEVSGSVAGGSHQFTWDDNYFNRTNLKWQFNEKHTISISSAPTYTLRTGDELLAGTFDPITAKGIVYSWVNGIAYQADLKEGKLQNVFFIKNYWQRVRTEREIDGSEQVTVNERAISDVGWGNNLRYNFSDKLIAKLSYEYALRLPRPDEVFGDGNFIIRNLELEAERSHNLNLSAIVRNSTNSKIQWRVETAGFVRSISNLIFLVAATDRTSAFDNVNEATSIGIEVAGELSGLVDGLKISLNSTYQDFYNSASEGGFARFEGERIPNTPYFFANSSVNYSLPKKLVGDQSINIYWSSRYVHSFFLGWESGGRNNPEFKFTIPNQHLHHAGMNYRMPLKSVKMTLTGDVQNVLNRNVFDFFGVQRPGRAYYLKIVTQF